MKAINSNKNFVFLIISFFRRITNVNPVSTVEIIKFDICEKINIYIWEDFHENNVILSNQNQKIQNYLLENVKKGIILNIKISWIKNYLTTEVIS